jgi:uncharacterized protein YndB with AHSA1/START domain
MQANHAKNTHHLDHKKSTPESRLLEISRGFEVPVDQLFDAFKTPDALKKWWWPEGLYTDHVDYDFNVGGRYFINLKGDDKAAGMTGKFEEIIANELIVMSDHFADKNGRAISAKEAHAPGAWPAKVYITFEFAARGADASHLKLSQQGIPNEMQTECMKAWNQMFDKLENYLIETLH